MGAATALYAAITHSVRIRAVILVRPPTAWSTRRARRANLLSSAAKVQAAAEAGDVYHWVLRGAATADLPPEDDFESYAKVTCPILILTVKGMLFLLSCMPLW